MPQYSVTIIRKRQNDFANKEVEKVIGSYVCEDHTEMMKATKILTNVFNSTDVKWMIHQLEE